MKFKLFSLCLLGLISTLSCKKYLEKKSNSALVVPQTLNDLQGLLDDTYYMNLNTPSLPESSSDDYFISDNTFNSLITREQQIYTWKLGDYYYPNDWSHGYLPVYNANVCLEVLDSIPKTSNNESQWNNVKGSALFYRAYYFLNLCWDFAKAYDSTSSNKDLGIILRLGSDFNVPSKRSTVEDCYDRIISDTKEAADYLPENSIVVTRPSKAAAYGLLARTYLSMRIYDSAFKYSNECLQIKNQLIDYNGDPDINGSLSSNAPFQQFNKETIFYSEMNREVSLTSYYYAFIDTTLVSSYDSNDLRSVAYFLSNGGYEKFKGSYSANKRTKFTGIATDEMYLIRSECFARKGMVSDAMNDLNLLMKNRYTYTTTFPVYNASNAEDALVIILKERRKELLLRGLRWMDIKRLNKEGFNIQPTRNVNGGIYTLPPNDNRFALPIPKDIINETGIEQN